jgi:hypothetical protein
MLDRLKLAAILIAFEIASYYILLLVPQNEMYYLVAGLLSFFIIPTIAKVGSDQLVIDLLSLALIMLVFQFIGLITYHLRLPVEFYNWPIHGLVIAQFLRLLIVRKNDGVDQHNNFLHLLCRFNLKGAGNLC